MANFAQHDHAQLLDLQRENMRLHEAAEKLKKVQAELSRYRQRSPVLRHYLGMIPKLLEYACSCHKHHFSTDFSSERIFLKEQLGHLGYEVELQSMPGYEGPFPDDDSDDSAEALQEAGPRNTTSNHTASRSAHNTGYAGDANTSSSPQSRRPHKRARVDTPSRSTNIHAAPSSRDQMPPPAKPSRMKSMRNMIPASVRQVRQKFSLKGKGKAPAQQSGSDVQMHEHDYHEHMDLPPEILSDRGRPPTHNTAYGEPYMSGALPVQHSRHSVSSSQTHPAPGGVPRPSGAEFTFRSSSPVKLDSRPSGHLPNEPSYIRLMDGLSRDTGLNLGLEDPRGGTSSQAYPYLQVDQSGQSFAETGPSCQRHSLEGYYSDTSPQAGPSSHGHRHQGSRASHLSGATVGNVDDRGAFDPVTSGPSQSRTTQEVDNVVSPFFGSSNSDRSQITRTKVAERNNSMSRLTASQSRRPPKLGPTPKISWREGRTLNGLSFFDTPVNDRNEPIAWRHERNPSEYALQPQRYQSRNLDSEGFIRRPDGGILPHVSIHPSVYSTVRLTSRSSLYKHLMRILSSLYNQIVRCLFRLSTVQRTPVQTRL
jgi:hypothetical protein